MSYYQESGVPGLPFEACATCVFSLHCMTTPRVVDVDGSQRTRLFAGRLCHVCGVQVRVLDVGVNHTIGMGFLDYVTFMAIPKPCRLVMESDTTVCPKCGEK